MFEELEEGGMTSGRKVRAGLERSGRRRRSV
jgi:hypothetical protein